MSRWPEDLPKLMERLDPADREVIIDLLDDIDGARSEAAHDGSQLGVYMKPFRELTEAVSHLLYEDPGYFLRKD